MKRKLDKGMKVNLTVGQLKRLVRESVLDRVDLDKLVPNSEDYHEVGGSFAYMLFGGLEDCDGEKMSPDSVIDSAIDNAEQLIAAIKGLKLEGPRADELKKDCISEIENRFLRKVNDLYMRLDDTSRNEVSEKLRTWADR